MAQNAPEVVRKLTEFYDREKKEGETLADVVKRVGKARVKEEFAGVLSVANL